MSLTALIFFCLALIISVHAKNNRIMDGIEVQNNELPYVASIRYVNPDVHFCTGAIISELHILTAGHCFAGRTNYHKNVVIYTGNISLTSGEKHNIGRVRIHPDYVGQSLSKNDIAVVTLRKHMKMNRSQMKIKLPVFNIIPDMVGIASGWGPSTNETTEPSSVLRKISMQVMRPDLCNNFFEDPIDPKQICAYNIFGKMLTIGDGGAPFASGDHIYGISVSDFQHTKNFPDIFVNVFYYQKFILDIFRAEHIRIY